MFERLGNGWRMGMESFRVLRTDKKLLLFPFFSFLACLLVLASFVLPLMNSKWAAQIADGGKGLNDPLVFILVFAFYFLNYFVIIFFNSALITCAIIRFNGGEPTIGDGLGAAMSRLPQILGWSLVSATVGIILKAIEQSSERAGEIISGILGVAWSVLTFFVIPVLVVEKVGPIKAFSRSCSLIKQTWGESLGARFGIGLIVFLLFLVACLPALLGILTGNLTAAVIGICITLVLIILVSLISAAVQVIITAALYQYAAEHRAPQQFDESLLRGAFGGK
jgi:hypothetical protein